MVISSTKTNDTKNVEFVSYTGKNPNLCSGELTLKINGQFYCFGGESKYNQFWCSGGSCSFDNEWNGSVSVGEWLIIENKLPEELKKYVDEIDRVFNENVDHGCCGGCL